MTDVPTKGARLERERLQHRAQRVDRVIAALRDRAVYRHDATGATPAPLKAAMADFNHELTRVRRRLTQLPR
jgi:hypothetical protein